VGGTTHDGACDRQVTAFLDKAPVPAFTSNLAEMLPLSRADKQKPALKDEDGL